MSSKSKKTQSIKLKKKQVVPGASRVPSGPPGRSRVPATDIRASAPIGVSAFSGPSIKILPSTRPDSLRVRARIPLCSVVQPGTNFYGFGAMNINGTSNPSVAPSQQVITTLGMGPLLLTGAATVSSTAKAAYACNADSSFITILASAFGRYRVLSDITLSYMPEGATNIGVPFALCFSEDYYSPSVGFGAWVAPTNVETHPTFNTCKISTNSVVFASWAEWSRTFPTDRFSEYYTSASLIGNMTSSEPYTAASFTDEQRLNYFGAMTLMCGSTAGGAASVVMGQLYYTLDYEFFDFVPVATGLSLPFTFEFLAQQARLLKNLKSESKDEKSEDYVLAGTPVHSTLRTSEPGTELRPVSSFMGARGPKGPAELYLSARK